MFLRFNTFTILWTLLILVATCISGASNANICSNNTDKWVHAFLFGVLFLIMNVGFKKQNNHTKLKFESEKYAIAICIGFGLAIEILQYFLPKRSFSILDLLADSIGVGFGLGLFYFIYKFNAR